MSRLFVLSVGAARVRQPTSWRARPGRTYTIRAGGAARSVRTGPGEVTVQDGAEQTADVTVSGPPTAVLRWVWNREGTDDAGTVTVEGPPEAVGELERCIAIGTQ